VATQINTTLTNNMTTDAHFRANCSFIHDLLVTTGGWVQTADTGQINFGTVTRPVAGNVKQGYAVYRMNDALQATAPLFLKIFFGTASTANSFGIWLVLGTGSDGTGTINGTVYYNDSAVAAPTVASISTALAGTIDSRGSADTSRFVFRMFDNASATSGPMMILAIERSKDASGDDTADGFIMLWTTSALGRLNRQVFIPAGAAPPAAETGVQFILSSNNPSSYGLDVGIGVPIPLLGYARQPGTGVIIAKTADFAAGTSLSFTFYGDSRTYSLSLATYNNGVDIASAATAAPFTRVGVRYD
jgi:hypothetical protein